MQDFALKVRVTDVARLAGCAPATVSRALNNPDKVSPEKRARVESAMKELGYVRNHAARALRSQRSHMVGVLIPTLDYAIYASLVGAATRRLSTAGISALVATFNYDLQTEFKEARLLIERGAEALILIGQKHDPALYSLLHQHDVCFVNTYTLDPHGTHPSVGFDNEAAAAAITRHLVHLGHRNICVISGRTRDNDRTITRLAGIRQELMRHGIELQPDRVIERSYSIANGREACATLLARIHPQPTALICGNDVLALGAIVECRERGLRIPEDISIVGFDNLELSKHSNPPLTTVDVPTEQMGDAAAGYLLDRLDGKEVSPQNSVEVQLILRHTTAPPAR
ncbi:transcriptional regulator, LacI family [Roseovarius azorensis]|uniref:Transcriptional regulator, LacI family n=1 Tax=Roseovarius azorensis TaxID=1287727 RepID=A0A1H7P1T6_9RHOB|nr:transcriptional regulator, LacI family [Roseovarius azorensis]